MTPLVFAFPGNEAAGQAIARTLDAELGQCEIRRFPDEESYVQIEAAVTGRAVAFVCTLDRPDQKFLPLAFAAATARTLGAASVGVVAPYLAYMRQDASFRPGDAISALHFGRFLSGSFDWLVTVDPHLHRLRSLDDIFAIPTTVVHAAPALSEWIRTNVRNPIVIGPDGESEQWVSQIAANLGAPYAVLQKERHGDRDVSITLPRTDLGLGRTPVLVDDMISTGVTMIEAMRHLQQVGARLPLCIGVHAIFADDAYSKLQQAGAANIVTCNTIAHVSNAIDLHGLLAEAVRAFLSPVTI